MGVLVLATAGPAGALVDVASPGLDAIASLPAGDTATVTGSGWDPDFGCQLVLVWTGPAVDGAAPGCAVDGGGQLAGTIPIPETAAPATYTVLACQPLCDQVEGFDNADRTQVVVLPPATTPTTTVPTTTEPTTTGLTTTGLTTTGLTTTGPTTTAPNGESEPTTEVSGTGTATGGGSAGEPVTPTSGDSGWQDPAVLVVLVLLVAAALTAAVRRLRSPAVPARPEALPQPLPPPVLTVEGADRPARWTIGIVTRPDPGTQTIEEPD